MPISKSALIRGAARDASRPTIGLLLTNQTWTMLAPQWTGVLDGAREQDVNLVCYAVGGLRSANPAEERANFLYNEGVTCTAMGPDPQWALILERKA